MAYTLKPRNPPPPPLTLNAYADYPAGPEVEALVWVFIYIQIQTSFMQAAKVQGSLSIGLYGQLRKKIST